MYSKMSKRMLPWNVCNFIQHIVVELQQNAYILRSLSIQSTPSIIYYVNAHTVRHSDTRYLQLLIFKMNKIVLKCFFLKRYRLTFIRFCHKKVLVYTNTVFLHSQTLILLDRSFRKPDYYWISMQMRTSDELVNRNEHLLEKRTKIQTQRITHHQLIH